MNVLHLISGGEVGGSKNHLLTLVNNMKKEEAKNIIVCFIKGSLYEEAVKMGIDVRLIKQSKRFDLSIVSKIKEICEKENIDIVNCHGGRANFIGYFLKKKYKAKYVTTIHSDYKEDYKGNIYKTLIYSNINRLVLNSFDYYITVSDNFKSMLVDRGFDERKIFVVYNGIDFTKKGTVNNKFTYKDNLINGEINGDSTQQFESSDSQFETVQYVSMIARFHPVKGHKVFLDACKIVLENFKDVIFILVGDGELKNELVEYVKQLEIAKNVCFVGFQKPDDYIAMSSFTVLASFSESFPLSILESAAYRKTVVSTDVGGISKLIENGENGYLVKVGDSKDMAEKMLDLLNNPEKAKEFGNKLYIKASTNFSIENFRDSYLEIYKKILTGGNDK
jgi:glycosyltransferase involved in cell wall biosynthesis